jgi:hypothetical protein
MSWVMRTTLVLTAILVMSILVASAGLRAPGDPGLALLAGFACGHIDAVKWKIERRDNLMRSIDALKGQLAHAKAALDRA